MSFKPRILEKKLVQLIGGFGAVLVTGPRQSGKTWLVTEIAKKTFEHVETVSFDTPSEIDAFRRDPDLFFSNRPGVLFLDEVQHVPDIFPYLKREIDRRVGSFCFFLSGSQHFQLMRGVTESLAGRTAVLDLWPLAAQEIRTVDTDHAEATVQLLENPNHLAQRVGQEYPVNDRDDVVPLMLNGGYPSVAAWNLGSDWLESYRRTYLQRDVRDLSQVGDLGRFDRFVALCAGRSATVLNKAELGRVLGVDHKTVDHWLSLLVASYQAISIPAYHSTPTKRVVRRPKWVFSDIGFALHLQGIRDELGLLNAPHFGSLFESFVIMELRKLWGHLGRPWDMCFWRTAKGLECDLVLPLGTTLVPIEIKHTASPGRSSLSALRNFMKTYPHQSSTGILISLHPRIEELAPGIFNVPLGLIINGPTSSS